MIYFKYKYAMEGVIFILDILFHENIFLSITAGPHLWEVTLYSKIYFRVDKKYIHWSKTCDK